MKSELAPAGIIHDMPAADYHAVEATSATVRKGKHDLTGRIFGLLKALRRTTSNYWTCQCECGALIERRSDGLTSGRSTSCGCLTRKAASARFRSHGGYKTQEYAIWLSMKQRCYNPKNHNYPNYGGRGIVMCDAWHDFAVFRHDVGPRPSPDHSLDRINNFVGYEPGNVRWATSKQQTRNMRKTCFLTVNGERRSISEWAERTGLRRATIYRRIKAKWAPNEIITLKPIPRNKRVLRRYGKYVEAAQ
jgi:hypothetical protein